MNPPDELNGIEMEDSITTYELRSLRLQGLKEVRLMVVTQWRKDGSGLAHELERQLKGKKVIIFGDGPIASGKTTCVEYVKKHFPEFDPYPQPIEQIRAITSQYYKKELDLQSANEAIESICKNQWLDPVKAAIKRNDQECRMVVEHLPPPFHSWIFEKAFGTTIEKEREATRGRMAEDRSSVIRTFTRHSIIKKTLCSFPELTWFDEVIVIIFLPSIDTLMQQLTTRGRSEENALSQEYMEYLRSKFDRALWELTERCNADPIQLRRYIDSHLEKLVERFP